MLKRSLLALPAIAGAALLAGRLVPGPLPDGSTLLPSGWRIRPAGRAVPVGTLPLNLVTLSDGSVVVTNDGYGANSLMRIDPERARVVWRVPAGTGATRYGRAAARRTGCIASPGRAARRGSGTAWPSPIPAQRSTRPASPSCRARAWWPWSAT